MNRPSSSACTVGGVVIGALSGAICANEITWTCGNLSFTSGGSWAGTFLPPAPDDVAVVACEDFTTAFFNDDAECNRLLVRNAGIELALEANTLVLNQAGFTDPGLVVGDLGFVTTLLRINDGTVFADFVDVASGPTNSGTLDVTGAGGTLDALVLTVGVLGDGALAITEGARVDAATAFIGLGATATGAATLDGGTLSVAGQLAVGNVGHGALTIESAALVESGTALLGVHEVSSAEATVNGATWMVSGGLDVGFLGTGALVISNGGLVQTGSFCSVGTAFSSTGVFSSGAITVRDPGSVLAVGTDLHLAIGGEAQLSVERSGMVTAAGDLLVSFTTAIGIGISGDGDYTDTVAIDAGGAAELIFDAIQIDVHLLDRYEPAAPTAFRLLRSQTSDVLIPFVTTPEAPAGFKWTPGLDADTLTVTYHAAADVTMDGVVNSLDLTQVIIDWGVCPDPTPCPSDVDDSGVVDVADLVLILLGWT